MLNSPHMSAFLKHKTNFKLISWLLMAAVLLITFLPAHYHLNHSDKVDGASAGTHVHIIDMYFLDESNVQSHHEGEVTTVAASPDGMLKKVNVVISLVLFLTFYLVVISGSIKCFRHSSLRRCINYCQPYSHFIPFLRAPPHLN